MGISPSELKHITPYEFNLLREGFFDRRKGELSQSWEQARLVAHTVYANVNALAGGTPTEMEDWYPLTTDQERREATEALPKARKIDSQYKTELQAKMNAIP